MLDADVLQNLTDEQKIRLTQLEKTFQSDGWNLIQAFISEQAHDKQQRMLFASTWDEFLELRGAARALAGFANFEQETYNEFVATAEMNTQDSIEDVELD